MLLGLLGAGAAQAQNYPARPITVLVGLAAGGSIDVVMRIYGEAIGKSLGQRLVIDNRPGGNGLTAAIALKQAAPDGYTIMVALGAFHTITPAMQALPLDPIADFEPISLLYSTPTFLAVPASSPANSVKELVELARTKPGGLNFGSPGVGSPAHLMGVLLAQKAGTPMTHVPYRGGGVMMPDLIAGRLDFAFHSYANVKSLIDQKQVKVLAIAASRRWNGAPDVPTLTQEGYSGVDVEALFGLMAPLGTPKAVVQKLRDEFAAASRDPDVIKRMDELGILIRATPPQELTAALKADLERLGKVVKTLGLNAQ
jgi:tripartite-type tricarboxylate transporter receptor subunit TctC